MEQKEEKDEQAMRKTQVYIHTQSIKDKESWKQLTQVKLMKGGVRNHKGGQTGSKAAKNTHSHYQSKTGSGDKKRKNTLGKHELHKNIRKISVKPKQGQIWTNTKLKTRTGKLLHD